MSTASGHNSGRILSHLHNLYFSENKPAELRPVDITLLTYLVLRRAEDHFINDSPLTLAQRLGCERRTIADSIKRLSELGWVVSKPSWEWNKNTRRKTRSIGKTAGLSINLDKLSERSVSRAWNSFDLARYLWRLLEILERTECGRQSEGDQQR